MIEILDKMKEECGVFGITMKEDTAAYDVYDGLYALQHRGQESAGIAVLSNGELKLRKRMGLVAQALAPEDLAY